MISHQKCRVKSMVRAATHNLSWSHFCKSPLTAYVSLVLRYKKYGHLIYSKIQIIWEMATTLSLTPCFKVTFHALHMALAQTDPTRLKRNKAKCETSFIGMVVSWHEPLARYVILRVARAPGMPGTFSPPPQFSDPDLHHGTCVTHVPWCMSGSLTRSFLWSRSRGKTFPAFLAHARSVIFLYLVRGPWKPSHHYWPFVRETTSLWWMW